MGVFKDSKDLQKLIKLKLLIAEVNSLLYKRINDIKLAKAPVIGGAKVIEPGSESQWTKLDSFLTEPSKSHLQWARYACRDLETVLIKGHRPRKATLGDIDALVDLIKDIHSDNSPIHKKSIINLTDRQIANTLWKYYNKLLNKLHKIAGIDTKVDHFGHWRIQIHVGGIKPTSIIRPGSGWNLVKTEEEVDVLDKIDKKDQNRDAMEALDETLDTYSRIYQLKSK